MRQWREVFGTETSYFVGQLYNDIVGRKRDGENHITGMLVNKVDRDTYFIIKTKGDFAYKLPKDKEFKP